MKNNHRKKSINHHHNHHHQQQQPQNKIVSSTNQYFSLAQSTLNNFNDTSDVQYEMGMYITNNGNININNKHNERKSTEHVFTHI